MSKFGWSYEDASNELDRIIQSTRSSLASKSAPVGTDESHYDTTATSCSICGHTQHSPSCPTSTPDLGSKHFARHTKDTPVSDMSDSFRSHASISRYRHTTGTTTAHNPQTPPSTTDKVDFGTNSSFMRKPALPSTPGSSSRLSYAFSQARATPKTPDSALITEARQSASSVVNAFRELQAKAKIIENERNSAMRIRDELRQELTESRRIQALARNKQEIRTNDHYLSIKASTEELLSTHSQVQADVRRLTETSSLLKEKLSNQYAKQNVLDDDIRRCDSEVRSAQERVMDLKRELIASQGRVDSMEKRLDTDSAAQERAMQAEIQRTKENSEREKLAAVRADIRLGALESYLNIILKVNGDLCDAIRNKEDADNRAIRMAERQMESALRTREREVNYILDKAEFIGMNKALEVSRKVNRFTNPYSMTTPATGRSVSFQSETDVPTRGASGHRRSKRTKQKRSHSSPRHSRDDSCLHLKLYDPMLIEAAARMAATAAATSVVAANSAAHCSACPPKKFIPAGSKTNKEFNVIASVSTAAREAKSLNARVASKVKSLDYQGQGPLYQDVNRVDLEAMHDHLRLVKKMHSRSIG